MHKLQKCERERKKTQKQKDQKCQHPNQKIRKQENLAIDG